MTDELGGMVLKFYWRGNEVSSRRFEHIARGSAPMHLTISGIKGRQVIY